MHTCSIAGDIKTVNFKSEDSKQYPLVVILLNQHKYRVLQYSTGSSTTYNRW